VKKQTQNLVEQVPEPEDKTEEEDGGMAGLAKSLGLDIDALAIELALKDDIAPA